MQHRVLGQTDIKVSQLCLGSMTWGEQNTEQEGHAQMDLALERGINFIDTAEMYPVPGRAATQGRTETYIGNWLKARGHRDKIVLATKIVGPGDHMKHIRGGSKFTREHIQSAIETSLRRLNTDYVDLYQLHWPERKTNFFGKLGYRVSEHDDSTPIEDTLDALNELIQAGKIRHYGLSNETAWGAMRFAQIAEQKGYPKPVSIQNPYNLLNRTYEVGLAEVSHREHMGLLAYSPLAFGALSGKYLNGQKPAKARLTLFEYFSRYRGDIPTRAIEQYVALAQEWSMSPSTLALAFVTQQAFVTSNIIGATSLEQLNENIDSADIVLTSEVLKRIEAIHTQIPNPCP